MKKIISCLLCICLVLGILPVNAMTDEIYTKYLKVSVNGNIKIYECLWDNEEIYCSVEDLAEISTYNWSQVNNDLVFDLFREHNNVPETMTEVCITVDDNEHTAKIEAMSESYSVNCHIKNEEVFLPLEKLLYLLHAEWFVENDTVYVNPMPLTILDFETIYYAELRQIASCSEDILIETGWLLSDNEVIQNIYMTVAEVFNDFDGKIFMLWWPGEGHVETAALYEDAILQLAKEDKEFVGEKVQKDAMEEAINSVFYLNNKYSNQIQNIMSIPENIDEIVQSVPDAVSLLDDISKKYPKIKAGDKFRNISDKIEKGEIDSSFLEIPEMKSKTEKLGKVADGLAILQCVWNVYDTANRVSGWNEEYLNQLEVLANYKSSEYINETVAGYVRSSAQRLLNSYHHPDQAAIDEAVQSTIGLLLSKTLDESSLGKVFSIMGAIGACYGMFDAKAAEVYDVYAELSVVSFSIKVEQLVRELISKTDLSSVGDRLTNENIEEFRNQLTLYLRLNLRNKAQLYDLNVRGNKDRNWVNTTEAKNLHSEIVKVYTMLAELIETKDYDSLIVLDNNLDNIYSSSGQHTPIPDEILTDEKSSVVLTNPDGASVLDLSLVCVDYEELNGMLAASIILSPDTTFEMTVNLYEGYGTIEGTYTLSDDSSIICKIESKDFSGFRSDSMQSFELVPKGDSNYIVILHQAERVGALEDRSIFSTEAQSETERTKLTDRQLEQIKNSLRVPSNLDVEIIQDEPRYWEVGECFLVYVEFRHNGELIASASVDYETLELVRNICVYSADN